MKMAEKKNEKVNTDKDNLKIITNWKEARIVPPGNLQDNIETDKTINKKTKKLGAVSGTTNLFRYSV